jgi:cell division protein FtsW
MDDDRVQLRSDAKIFLSIVLLLTCIGLVFIYSASSVFALEKFGSAHYFLKKQLFYCIPAIGFFLVLALIPVSIMKRFIPLLFFISLGLTLMTILPPFSLKMHGARRWLSLYGKTFQPSELLKLSLFLYLGLFLERKQRYIQSFFYCYLPFMMVLGASSIVLLLQPDFGSVVTIMTTTFILFFVAEFNLIHLGATVFAALPVALYLIISKQYRLNRILIFLNPWSDPQGRGFQIIQSLIAIGSGQWWGLGIANSKQKFFYLPMQHTDFIFSIIAEETGLVGSTLLVIIFFGLFFYGMRIVNRLSEPFEFFTALAFVLFLSLQVVINIMVAIGLLPTKGLGLPFISYGGSGLICSFGMIGVICNFCRSVRTNR